MRVISGLTGPKERSKKYIFFSTLSPFPYFLGLLFKDSILCVFLKSQHFNFAAVTAQHWSLGRSFPWLQLPFTWTPARSGGWGWCLLFLPPLTEE